MRRLLGSVLLLAVCLAPTGCGGDPTPELELGGIYVLDRSAYARVLVLERIAEGDGVASRLPTEEERRRLLAEARRTAESISLRLDLGSDKTFIVRYRFGKETGRFLGAWSLHGGRLSLRTTHDAAGPVKSGAQVEADVDEGGIHFKGWPVPHDFTLRRP